MNDSLEAPPRGVLDRIQRSDSEKELEQIRVETLGRSGSVTLLLRGMKDVPAEDRPRRGEQLNQLRRVIEERLGDRLSTVQRQARARALSDERIDITLPGARLAKGGLHPLT